MLAKLSTLGLYKADPTIFDGLVLPTAMDKDSLISNIIAESAELATMYPNPAAFKYFLDAWSRRKLPIWEKLYRTVTITYDPIENYDRIEEWVDVSHGNSNTSDNTSATNTNSATAFNSDSLKTTDRVSHSAAASGESSSNIDTNHTGRVHGNIGVTTTQQMLDAERQTALYDVYEVITSEFIDAFCVRVYY